GSGPANAVRTRSEDHATVGTGAHDGTHARPAPPEPAEELRLTPKEVIALAKEQKVRYVDLRFNDFPGTWQHFSIPIETLEEDSFEEGFAFDGSSIRGFKTIDQSD